MNTNNPITRLLRVRLRRFNRKFTFSKRQQFVGITLILTICLVMTQLVSGEYRYPMVVFLTIVAYGLCAFGLREDLKGVEWITLLTLPTLFTAAVSLFYFLLPIRWLTRLPIATLYAIGIYALLLTENIYNVAVNRTIALLRAGHSVGFLMTLVTYFLLLQTIFAFRLPALGNVLFVLLITVPLALETLWATTLEGHISPRVWSLTIVLSLVLMQLSWVFSFWPVRSTLFALFLTTVFYSLGGMAQQYMVEKLYKKSVIEFFSVSFIVYIIVFLATHWRGNG